VSTAQVLVGHVAVATLAVKLAVQFTRLLHSTPQVAGSVLDCNKAAENRSKAAQITYTPALQKCHHDQAATSKPVITSSVLSTAPHLAQHSSCWKTAQLL
jgi:predicted  nucleic acid-binding Zn ribbon protein